MLVRPCSHSLTSCVGFWPSLLLRGLSSHRTGTTKFFRIVVNKEIPRPGHDIVQSRALYHSLALLELDFINNKSGFLSFYDCQLIVYIDFDLY